MLEVTHGGGVPGDRSRKVGPVPRRTGDRGRGDARSEWLRLYPHPGSPTSPWPWCATGTLANAGGPGVLGPRSLTPGPHAALRPPGPARRRSAGAGGGHSPLPRCPLPSPALPIPPPPPPPWRVGGGGGRGGGGGGRGSARAPRAGGRTWRPTCTGSEIMFTLRIPPATHI